MTQEEAEAIYDDEIAPKLYEIGKRCEELGFSIVAHVEWHPGETGITQHVPDSASAQMRMTQLAAHAHGNFDSLCINVMKRFPESREQSLFLRVAAQEHK